MDGGGRLDQSLRRSGHSAAERADPANEEPCLRRRAGDDVPMRRPRAAGAVRRFAQHLGAKAIRWPPRRGVGIAGSILLLGATLSYGAIAGQHLPEISGWFKDARDALANSLGFDIAAISLTGVEEVSRDEVLSVVGVTGHASLLFLDADAARARLLANPWIADAAVLKLYPNRLQITIVERHPFALWQKDGRLSVIAADGTVLEPMVEQRYLSLPLVVGEGADRQARDFLAIVDRYPALKTAIQASILVAQRRWNLRLNNGIDVRLPETNVAAALDRLVTLDRDKKLLSRDITVVDLRLPDRVTVRLSDAAAAARADALKDKTKKKGGDT
jgi:cell division protein FtsQ